VPSGNFGNVCAGHIARMMGLPIEKLVVATNENDVLDEFFKTGVYRARKSAETFHTTSPSMDISKASNFERFVYDLVGRDAARTAGMFKDVDAKGGFDLSKDPVYQDIEKYGFVSGKSTHANRLETIRDVHAKYSVLIDTHTADGVKVARENLEADIPMLVLETALPIKFAETIEEAIGRAPDRPASFVGIEDKPQRVTVMAADVNQVKDFLAQHTGL